VVPDQSPGRPTLIISPLSNGRHATTDNQELYFTKPVLFSYQLIFKSSFLASIQLCKSQLAYNTLCQSISNQKQLLKYETSHCERSRQAMVPNGKF
jgi:hypothetical protein